MPNAQQSIVDEVETVITTGSAENRLETIKRVTDLFLSSAGSFNGEQIELFDNVLERLIKTIEIRAISDVSARIALAEVSTQLAAVSQAPPSVVRRLARHDEITVAGPVLMESAVSASKIWSRSRKTKSEQHLLAIAGRWWLKEVVTDALLARRYPSVSRRIVNNPARGFPRADLQLSWRRLNPTPNRVETGIRIDLPPRLASSTAAQRDRSGPVAAVVARAS